VEYAALNFADTLMIEGRYQARPELPFSPGAEFSGRVLALGPGATGPAPGTRVAGYVGHGAARERISVRAETLVEVPAALGLDRAAGLTVAYGTTLHALDQRAGLAPGESLVVLGASGGVGLAAVETGARMGARVIAVASTDEKLAFARAHGATEAINASTQNLRAELKRLGGPAGIDVVYDPVGGAQTEIALRSLGWKGRLLVIGFASGEIPRPPLNLTLLKGSDVRGVNWPEFVKREPEAHRANMERLTAWAAEGALSAHVHAVHALSDFVAAFASISGRAALGKVLVRPKAASGAF
jgi:NADPH2:quinone reductase